MSDITNALPKGTPTPSDGTAAAARRQPAPMDERTLAALQGSIEKWRAIEAGTGKDNAAWNCPLCALFLLQGGCNGCPVFARTGAESCQDTPFVEWVAVQLKEDRGHPFLAITDRHKALARAEREFLESLLPRAAASVTTDHAKDTSGKHGGDEPSAVATPAPESDSQVPGTKTGAGS